MHLLNHGMTRDKITDGVYDIHPDLLLVVKRALHIPPLVQLTCTLRNEEGLLLDLHLIGEIVKMPTLREVNLQFPMNLLGIQLKRQTLHSPENIIAAFTVLDQMITVVRGMLFNMADKLADKRVIFVDSSTHCRTTSCRSDELGPWICDTTTTSTSGKAFNNPQLKCMTSLRMRSMDSALESLANYTLIENNPHDQSSILIGGPKFSLSAAETAVVLPHITRPALETLNLGQIELDQESFTKFLERHRFIDTLYHQPGPKLSLRRPLRIPTLRSIEVNNIASITPLLAVIEPPKAHGVVITFDLGSSVGHNRRSFRLMLQSVAAFAGARSVGLSFAYERGRGSYCFPAAARGDKDIVAALRCIGSVSLWEFKIPTARKILSWFQGVPRVKVFLKRHRNVLFDSAQWTEFVREVEEQFPGALVL
ncbi:hypothetical protein C8R46DRAFT_1042666 [Mycena filopes]|nr:hypothetical protein C8R46DRAFT_1042666 [Mycena filopes]